MTDAPLSDHNLLLAPPCLPQFVGVLAEVAL